MSISKISLLRFLHQKKLVDKIDIDFVYKLYELNLVKNHLYKFGPKIYLGAITSFPPMYGLNTSGITTEPSVCACRFAFSTEPT